MNHIQQIFQDHGAAYVQRFGQRMPEAHRKVIEAVCDCRTGARGYHVFACPDCSEKHVANSSCGNRHCPVCQHEKGVQWVYRQQRRLLPCNYFLVHVKALSRLFRGKFRARLKALKLLDSVPAEVWKHEWVVNCQHVGSGARTLKYLGAYLFRVAISDARIVAYDGKCVTFKWQKVGSARWRKTTLPVMEFMRRYLQHVLPSGFMRVRHFGFLSHSFGMALDRIRELITALGQGRFLARAQTAPPKPFKPLLCPRCQAVMTWVCFLSPLRATGT